tara:strand:+ start:564 stop:1163 length:600 start_codon:yes stop_codon:yes gene_type:complete
MKRGNNNMRMFLTVLVLIFCFQSWTKADDIRDFEIEGISIGDSLLEHFSEKYIKDSLATYYKDNTHSTARTTSDKYENYNQLDISFITKDKNYKIIGISAALYSENIPEGCKEKSKEIKNLIGESLDEDKYIYEETTSVHPVDSSGKSTVDSKYYYFANGDVIAIQCYNFSKETNFISALKINVAKSIHVDWLEDKAYN